MSETFDFHAEILRAAEIEDTSPGKIAFRTAKRIVTLGFDLEGFDKQAGHSEGFNWGRSSIGRTTKTMWVITFANKDNSATHTVNVVVSNTTYEKRNPYDSIPSNNNKPSFTLMAIDDTKDLLGWPKGESV